MKLQFHALTAAVLLVAPVLVAGSAAVAQDMSTPPVTTPGSPAALPPAPSAVMLAQYGSALPPGSGRMYVPSGTEAGVGEVKVELAVVGPQPLTLDDAIAFTLERNLKLRLDRTDQKLISADKLIILQAILPSLNARGSSSAREIDLAAMGFNPNTLGSVPQLGNVQIPLIVKVNVTQAQLSLDQTLFSLQDYEIYQGAREEFKVINLDREQDRDDAVQVAAMAYLRVLADKATVENAIAVERSAKQEAENAADRRAAGVGTSLDQLRGQVDYQQRTQQRLSDEATELRDRIQLNRIMGVPAEQQWDLTDTVPFMVLGDVDLARARQIAYAQRKDLLSLGSQVNVAHRAVKATKFERYPTLGVNGYYGVLGETTGLYHGVFTAQGSLRIPIFREAAIRGDEELAGAQLTALNQRQQSLRADIDAEIRSNLLDVTSDADLVRVAQSSLDLAQQELSDEQARFKSGVDDNLPLVRAEATLAGAQSQLVNATFQYNVAKLALAHSTGILTQAYRAYLGK